MFFINAEKTIINNTVKLILCLLSLILLLSGCSGKKAEKPVFTDGMAQPVFPYTEVNEDYDNRKSDIIRYCVWVETDNDMDKDGEKDLVKALVQVPRAAYKGTYKAASIFEARPYIAGTLDLKADDNAVDLIDADINPEDWKYTSPFDEELHFYEDLNWYDYFLVRGFAVVSSAGPGTLGSDGFVSVGSKEETEAFAAIIEWLHAYGRIILQSRKTVMHTVVRIQTPGLCMDK